MCIFLKTKKVIRQEAKQRLVSRWQNYCESGDDLDPSSPMKRTVRFPSVEDDDMLPLSDGVLTTNLGLDMVVIVTKVSVGKGTGKVYNSYNKTIFFCRPII